MVVRPITYVNRVNRVVIVDRNDAIAPAMGAQPRPLIEKALREVGHPDAERLTGVGLRLQTAVDALDQWANGSNQEAGQ